MPGVPPLMPNERHPAMGRQAAGERPADADRRPGLRRRHPVRPLHPLGGGALRRGGGRLQPGAAAADPPDSRRRRPVRPLGGRARLRRLPPLERPAAPARHRRRHHPWRRPLSEGRSGEGGAWRTRLDQLVAARPSAHRPRLGRPADPQQRPQPLGASERLGAADATGRGSPSSPCRRDRARPRSATISAARR